MAHPVERAQVVFGARRRSSVDCRRRRSAPSGRTRRRRGRGTPNRRPVLRRPGGNSSASAAAMGSRLDESARSSPRTRSRHRAGRDTQCTHASARSSARRRDAKASGIEPHATDCSDAIRRSGRGIMAMLRRHQRDEQSRPKRAEIMAMRPACVNVQHSTTDRACYANAKRRLPRLEQTPSAVSMQLPAAR